MRVASTRSACTSRPGCQRRRSVANRPPPRPSCRCRSSRPWAPCSGPGGCARLPGRSRGVRHACQTGPILTGEDADATHEWQHGRQPDTRTDTLGARGDRPDQVTDPASEQLESSSPMPGRSGVGSLSGWARLRQAGRPGPGFRPWRTATRRSRVSLTASSRQPRAVPGRAATGTARARMSRSAIR